MTDAVRLFASILIVLGICGGIFAIGYLAHELWNAVIGWLVQPSRDQGCKHEVTSDIRWTEDGWVSVCLVCREWIYYGDGEHPTL